MKDLNSVGEAVHQLKPLSMRDSAELFAKRAQRDITMAEVVRPGSAMPSDLAGFLGALAQHRLMRELRGVPGDIIEAAGSLAVDGITLDRLADVYAGRNHGVGVAPGAGSVHSVAAASASAGGLRVRGGGGDVGTEGALRALYGVVGEAGDGDVPVPAGRAQAASPPPPPPLSW